jgi:hypothetical protein
MMKLVHRTLVGQSSEGQWTGTFVHPTLQLLLLHTVTSQISSDAFLTYWREQFEYEQPKTSLEFHQLLDRCLSTAQRMDVSVSFVGVGIIEDRVVLAAYKGSVWLKRGQKSGQILSSDQKLEILEGKVQAGDTYLLFTQEAAALHEVVQSQLVKLEGTRVFDVLQSDQLLGMLHQAPQQAEMGVTTVMVQEEEEGAEQKVDKDEATAHFHETPVLTVAELEHIKSEEARLHAKNGVAKFFKQTTKKFSGVITFFRSEYEQLFSQDIYVRRRHRKALGSLLIFGVVLLLTVVGTFAYFRNRDQVQRREVTTFLQPYRVKLNDIRVTLTQNPFAARQQTEQVIADLELQSQRTDQPAHITTAVSSELAAVREFYQSISGQEELPVLPTFFDLRLVQSNFLANAVDVTPDTLFFLDSGQRKILALNIEKKQPTLLSIGEFPEIRALVADERFVYFLGQGLFRFTLSGTEIAKLVKNTDETIASGQSIGVFGSYVYVMNKGQNNIFRYTVGEDQLDSKPAAWVQTSEALDLSTVQNFSIDGDIWLGTTQGEVKKFTSGRESEFSITGLREAFSSPTTVFTKPDLQNLYVLEPQKNRVVVLSKKGEFLKEVKSSTLGAATGIVASEKVGKAFALSGSLVFEIQL